MIINYTKYPLLLFLSYDEITAPESFPFEFPSDEARAFFSNSPGFLELMGYFGLMNTSEKSNNTKHYLITKNLSVDIDENDLFRSFHLSNFTKKIIYPMRGTIIDPLCGQYVFLLMSKEETKTTKQMDGRYFATALFNKNIANGFEEALITNRGIELLATGYYHFYSDIYYEKGSFLSVISVFLSYLQEQKDIKMVKPIINLTKEIIYRVS